MRIQDSGFSLQVLGVRVSGQGFGFRARPELEGRFSVVGVYKRQGWVILEMSPFFAVLLMRVPHYHHFGDVNRGPNSEN